MSSILYLKSSWINFNISGNRPGCLYNKVNVSSIINKQKNFHYQNGKNPDSNIIYLRLIENESLISLKIKRGSEILFKSHKTENISSRELLQLQGIKLVYQDYDIIEYKILPLEIFNDINKLVFSSFTAEGKSVFNSYYKNEWEIVKKFISNLLD